MQNLKSIKTQLFIKYLENIQGVYEKFDGLKDAEISTENFSFYTSVSSVFSSKIEGEDIDLDSFVKHRNFGIEFQRDYTKKTDDLYEAYQFAKENSFNKENLLSAHKILTRNILAEHLQGKYRTGKMYVLTDEGQIEYIATSPFEVESEMEIFLSELEVLLKEDLTIEECNLRVDWQTLRRLPLSGGVVFNFKALFTPVQEFRDEPYVPALLLKLMQEGKQSLMEYKNTWHVEHVCIPALQAYAKEQVEKGLVKDEWEVTTLDDSPYFPGWEEKWHRQQAF